MHYIVHCIGALHRALHSALHSALHILYIVHYIVHVKADSHMLRTHDTIVPCYVLATVRVTTCYVLLCQVKKTKAKLKT